MGVFLSVCVRVIKKLLILLQQLSFQIRGSIVVSISACHAEDPGSIPGRGEKLCCVNVSAAIVQVMASLLPGHLPVFFF